MNIVENILRVIIRSAPALFLKSSDKMVTVRWKQLRNVTVTNDDKTLLDITFVALIINS